MDVDEGDSDEDSEDEEEETPKQVDTFYLSNICYVYNAFCKIPSSLLTVHMIYE